MNDTYIPNTCFLNTANLNAEKLTMGKLDMSRITICNKEIEAFYDMVVTSGATRLVITVFDGNNVTNTIIPAWRFEALNPFLNASKSLRIIDVYIDAESHETSLWAVLVVDNKVNLYKEWLNDRFGIHSLSKEFVRKENR